MNVLTVFIISRLFMYKAQARSCISFLVYCPLYYFVWTLLIVKSHTCTLTCVFWSFVDIGHIGQSYHIFLKYSENYFLIVIYLPVIHQFKFFNFDYVLTIMKMCEFLLELLLWIFDLFCISKLFSKFINFKEVKKYI